MVEYFKPIATECLLVDYFPPVALYLRRGQGNFILYKTYDIELTERDLDRFGKNSTQFVYVRAGDAEHVARYLEEQISSIIQSDDLTTEAKESILSVITYNYLDEVFKSPELIGDVARCKKILKALIKSTLGKKSLMRSTDTYADECYQFFTHSIDVTSLSILAHESILALQGDELLEVAMGSMFHDVGLIYLTSNTVDGPYPFMDIDYSRVKLHPHMGYNVLLPLWGNKGGVALDIVRHHHEKFDGSGYPQNLAGARIPESAQLVSICDVYSSLTTDRPFRKASPPKYTLEIMESESHIFNREYLRAFKEMILGLQQLNSSGGIET